MVCKSFQYLLLFSDVNTKLHKLNNLNTTESSLL